MGFVCLKCFTSGPNLHLKVYDGNLGDMEFMFIKF